MSSEDQTYSGWANYETWVVNLWLTNEPDTNAALAALAQDREAPLHERLLAEKTPRAAVVR